ncbi:MAG: NUDIX hydrolase [Candidatus Omnitrophica bacterium]|jgi:hypothetical protein|nr:NUDIX hydrolase [Candidatus Omnitrophota bacterium]
MKKISERITHKGRWLQIKELHYKNRTGEDVTWESIERVKTKKVLVIIATLMPSRRYVLIKQFRHPINSCIIGFPAGIAYTNDAAAEALKELREETGYRGTVTAISPELALNPALTNELVQIVSVIIDEHDPHNTAPVQKLEPEEEIEVMLAPKKSIRNFLIKQRKNGVQIGVSLWYLFVLSATEEIPAKPSEPAQKKRAAGRKYSARSAK